MARAFTTGKIANTGYPQKTIKFKNPITISSLSLLNKSNADSVSFGSSNLAQVLTQERMDEIIDGIEDIEKGGTCRFEGYQKFGDGTTSVVHKVSDDCVVKVLKPKHLLNNPSDPQLTKEAFALQYAKELGLKDSQEYLGLTHKNGKSYLFSTFLNGSMFSKTKEIKEEPLKDFIRKLTLLDQKGLLHCDLQSDNIFINGDKAGLMDFGAFTILKDDGFYLKSTTLPQVITPRDIEQYRHEISSEPTQKFLRIFQKGLNEEGYYSRSNNPFFRLLSNVENFEYRGLYYRLMHPKSPDETQNLFKKYIKIKAEEHHAPMAEFLKSLNADEITGNLPDRPEELLKKAIQHEEASARLLGAKNVLENVQKTELESMQLRHLIFESCHSGSTEAEKLQHLETIANLKAEFNRFREMISGFAQKAETQDEKIYFNNILKLPDCFRWAEERCIDATGNPVSPKTLPEDKDILKLMFEKSKESIMHTIDEAPIIKQPETVPTPEIIKKGIGKKWLATGAAIATVIGFGMHLYNSHNKRKSLKISSTSNTVALITPNNPTANTANQTNPFSSFNFNRQENTVFKDFLAKV